MRLARQYRRDVEERSPHSISASRPFRFIQRISRFVSYSPLRLVWPLFMSLPPISHALAKSCLAWNIASSYLGFARYHIISGVIASLCRLHCSRSDIWLFNIGASISYLIYIIYNSCPASIYIYSHIKVSPVHFADADADYDFVII